MQEREPGERTKYREFVTEHGGRFYGCAIESNGALSRDFLALLQAMATASEARGYGYTEFLDSALYRVSVVLQQGNAGICIRAVGGGGSGSAMDARNVRLSAHAAGAEAPDAARGARVWLVDGAIAPEVEAA